MTNTEASKEASEGTIPPKKSEANWLARAAWLASFVTATLVLLGYGVSLAAESLFGIPHAAVFDSTFELIDLASIAVLEIFPTLSDALSQWALYVKLYKELGLVIGSFAAIWIIVAVVGRFWRPKRSNGPKPVKAKKPERLYWGRTEKQYWLGHAFMMVSIAISPLFSLLGVMAIVVMLTVLSIVPIIGMSAGTAHINKWVIAPEQCMPTASLESRRLQLGVKRDPGKKTTHVAQCVAVKKDGNVIALGRVVFYTSKAVVLTEDNGRTQRVPTTDAIVEAVSDISARTTVQDKSDKAIPRRKAPESQARSS